MPHYKDTAANRKLGRVGKAYGKVTASTGMKFKIKAKEAPKAVAVKKVVTNMKDYVPGVKGQFGEKIRPIFVKYKIRPKPDRKISGFKAPSNPFASLMPPVKSSLEKMTGLSKEAANKMSPAELFGMLPKELGKMVLLPSQRGGGVKIGPVDPMKRMLQRMKDGTPLNAQEKKIKNNPEAYKFVKDGKDWKFEYKLNKAFDAEKYKDDDGKQRVYGDPMFTALKILNWNTKDYDNVNMAYHTINPLNFPKGVPWGGDGAIIRK